MINGFEGGDDVYMNTSYTFKLVFGCSIVNVFGVNITYLDSPQILSIGGSK